MPRAKFDWIPERQLNKADSDAAGYRVSITGTGQLYFSRSVIEIYELEGKVFMLYADIPKKAIAWKIMTGKIDETGLKRRDMRRLTSKGKAMSATFSIQSILSSLGITIPKKSRSFKNIAVKTDKSSYLEDELSYIELGNLSEHTHEKN